MAEVQLAQAGHRRESLGAEVAHLGRTQIQAEQALQAREVGQIPISQPRAGQVHGHDPAVIHIHRAARRRIQSAMTSGVRAEGAGISATPGALSERMDAIRHCGKADCSAAMLDA